MFEWIVGLVSSYTGKKILDQAVKKGARKESLEHQLINALNKSLIQTCKHFSVDVVMVERSEPFLHNLTNSKGKLSFNCIAKTLEQVTGIDFNEDIIIFWQESFKQQIIEYEKLFKYINLYGADINNDNLYSGIPYITDFCRNVYWRYHLAYKSI